MAKIKVDVENIEKAGFDRSGSKANYGIATNQRYMKSQYIAGGKFSSDTTIELGSGNIRIDSKNKRIIVNDGQYDRVLIGYLKGGFE